MTEPTTAASRRLRDEYPGVWYWEDPDDWEGPIGIAIEREAVAAALARVRERVAGLDDQVGLDWISRAAVLAILDEEAASRPASHQPTAPERGGEHE